MSKEHQIVEQVYDAKGNMERADALIQQYLPFIKSEVSKFLSRICTEEDDEFSIAMIAFHEAIQGYSKERGTFFSFASLTIRSRLTDFQRKEWKHQGHISMDEYRGEDEIPLHEKLADERDYYSESADLEATRQEIAELDAVMKTFGVTLTDIAENSPKQDRTLSACARVVRYAAANRQLLDELLRTKKLPQSQLAQGADVDKKTLERHRKYILAMLLIQTNGYEIIRGHLKHVLREKGGAAV